MNPSQCIERLRKGDSSFTKLKLTFPSQEYLNDLCQLLSGNTSVTYVLVERHFANSLSSNELKRALKAIGEMKCLQELEIWGCKVPLGALCRALGSCHTLRKLGMGFVGLCDLSSSCQYLEGHPTLKQVYLSEFRFAVQQADDETVYADNELHVRNLDPFLRALSTCPCMESVEFVASRVGGDSWSSEGLVSLVESSSIRSLTMLRMHLNPLSIVALANALRNHPHSSLHHLDLSENEIGDEPGVAIVESAVEHQYLRSLKMRDNTITAAGCCRMAAALRQGRPGLDRLNLTGNAIGDRGAHALANLLKSREGTALLHLELARTEITDDGCIALANAVQDNTSLLGLGLANNKISTVSYLAFAKSLQSNRTLKSLHVQANRLKVDLKAYEALVSMLEENHVLEEVSTSPDTREHKRKKLKETMTLYLRLNQAGRRVLMQGNSCKMDWVSGIEKVKKDISAIYYLVRAYPSICSD